MPKRRTDWPEAATKVTTYAELEEMVRAFARGGIRLLVILGNPGLGKGKLVQRAMLKAIQRNRVLCIKGRKSGIDLYTDLYRFQDKPVVLDDADDLMADPLCLSYVKALTETDTYSRLDYSTKTKILEKEGVPRHFWTRSSVCIIVNHWDGDDPILRALVSRGEIILFQPDWPEVYRYAGKWFWDQEIFDYLHERLPDLREPDLRLLVKAYARKKAGMKKMPWRAVIDEHSDDEIGMTARMLMDTHTITTNTARAEAFCEITGADRATFYRRMQQIKKYRPSKAVRRIVLKHTAPKHQDRPSDGVVVEG